MLIEVGKVVDVTIPVALIRGFGDRISGHAYVMLKPQADDCIMYQVYDDGSSSVMLQKITWAYTCPRIEVGGSLFYAVDDSLLDRCIRPLTDEDWKWQREFGYLEEALAWVYAGGLDDRMSVAAADDEHADTIRS